MPVSALAIDANILIRAVLGKKVRSLIETYSPITLFIVPEPAYRDAEHYAAAVITKRGGDAEPILELLRRLVSLIEVIGPDAYGKFEAEAKMRLATRDPEDWPMLAAALAFDCPIWTEDTDFFGCGVPTWTSDRVEFFLKRTI